VTILLTQSLCQTVTRRQGKRLLKSQPLVKRGIPGHIAKCGQGDCPQLAQSCLTHHGFIAQRIVADASHG
jgi:hypothetical protein